MDHVLRTLHFQEVPNLLEYLQDGAEHKAVLRKKKKKKTFEI